MNSQVRGVAAPTGKKKALQAHVHTIEQGVVEAQNSVRRSISAGAEKLTLLPAMTQRLEAIGKADKIDDLLGLAKSMASDIDSYISESERIDIKFDEVRKSPPHKPGKLGTYNNKCLQVGGEYNALDYRIANNLLPSLQQLLSVAELDVQPESTKEATDV